LKSKQQFSLLEIILRFIVLSIEGDVISRPRFMKYYAMTKFKFEKDDSDDSDDSNDEYDNSDFVEKKDPDRFYNPMRQPNRGTGAATGAVSSSSSNHIRGRKKNLLGPCCWADTEDPRRNMIPSPLTLQQELSVLEGDAKFVTRSRVGDVYRKSFNGIDTVYKLHSWALPRENDMGSHEDIDRELRRERRAYKILKNLQGKFVPRFLKYAPLIEHFIDVFATEYAGEPLTSVNDVMDKSFVQSALKALQEIHSKGVLHGDVENLNNLLISPQDQAVFVDFGACKFKAKDEIDDVTWEKLTKHEYETLQNALGARQRKKVVASDPRSHLTNAVVISCKRRIK